MQGQIETLPRLMRQWRRCRFGADRALPALTGIARSPFYRAMNDGPRWTTARGAAQDARRARALRENLRRRKEQARARAPQTADPPSDAEEPPLEDRLPLA